jgi:hypothetical protein
MTGMPEPGNGIPEPLEGMPHDGNGMPQQTGGMPCRPVTGKPHFPCSHPPKPRGAAYDRRPAPGPGRTRRHAAARLADRQEEVRVIVPDQPPALTPAAARALLRILLDGRAQMGGHERRECP